MSELYTTQEAARLIGISDGHLRTLISEGKAHPVRQIGGTNMFDEEEIERLRNRSQTKGRPPKGEAITQ